MPAVDCGVVLCTRLPTDLAAVTEAVFVTVRFALLGRADPGLTALDRLGFFADLMASFMTLAPVRTANRVMALSERCSDRLKMTT